MRTKTFATLIWTLQGFVSKQEFQSFIYPHCLSGRNLSFCSLALILPKISQTKAHEEAESTLHFGLCSYKYSTYMCDKAASSSQLAIRPAETPDGVTNLTSRLGRIAGEASNPAEDTTTIPDTTASIPAIFPQLLLLYFLFLQKLTDLQLPQPSKRKKNPAGSNIRFINKETGCCPADKQMKVAGRLHSGKVIHY